MKEKIKEGTDERTDIRHPASDTHPWKKRLLVSVSMIVFPAPWSRDDDDDNTDEDADDDLSQASS